MNRSQLFVLEVAMDVGMVFMYYLWRIEGVEPAGGVFMFGVWSTVGMGLFMMVLGKPSASHYCPAPAHYEWYCQASTAAILFATIWAGQDVAAAMYLITWILSFRFFAKSKRIAEGAR